MFVYPMGKIEAFVKQVAIVVVLVDRGRNVPDCLPVSSDRQNIFLPVSTNIQLEQYYFNILFSLFKTQLGLYNR